MLTFYDGLKSVPKGIKTVRVNDSYFNAHTKLADSDLVRLILNRIDKAVRISDISFKGRSDKFGDLDKQHLSTGTKTLINILQHPHECFNISECGANALELLPLINDGMIYCDRYINIPITSDNINCSISFDGEQFVDLREFRNYYEANYDEKNPNEL